MKNAKASKRARRRELAAMIAGRQYEDLLQLLEPEVRAEHLRLLGGDVIVAGQALCTPFPVKPMIERYLFDKSDNVLRTLRFTVLIGSRPDLLERLKRATVVLTD